MAYFSGKFWLLDYINLLVYGAPGCGKTRRVLIPAICGHIAAGDSVLCLDPKGELGDYTEDFAKGNGYKVVRVMVDNPLHSPDTINPLDAAITFAKTGRMDDAVAEVSGIAKVICPTKSKGNPHFDDSARSLCEGLLLAVIADPDIPEECKNLATVNAVASFAAADGSTGLDRIRKIARELPNGHPAKSKLSQVANTGDEEASSIISTFTNKLNDYVDARVSKMLWKSTFHVEDMAKEKTIIYLSFTSANGNYGKLVTTLVTNAISQFKPTEENMRSVMSPSELLQGRIAGVSISTSSGNLGSAEKMSIRGSSSLSASNEPLYVIDGIPLSNNSASLYSFGENMSSLATLNLTDIESIEVLKDAASAAIYGSRATNGVVLITTKQGREGKSEVKVNYGFSITQFPNTGRREYVGSKQYVEVFNEGVDNYNRQNGFTVNSSGYVKPIRNPYGDMPDTDWLDLITRLGQSHYLDLSFSGGNAKTKYYLSGSYNYQEGVIKTNDISKVNLKSNINHEMFKWLKVGANISGNYLHNNRIPGADLGSTIIGRAVQQRPFDRPYKPNGGYYTGGTDELLLHNAVQILSEETSYTDNYRFIGSFWAEAQIIKGLTVRASYNNDSAYTYDYIYYNQNHPYAADKGRILDRNRFVMTNTIDLYANYNRKIGEDFELGAMVGHSFLKTRSRTSYIDAQNYPSPAFDVASVAANIVDASAGLSEYAIESYFARLSLAYKDRYVVNATIRTDGSSRFAPDCRWGWFPSVSVGWNVSNESFWNAEKTDLKIRASYGRTGNQDGISNYGWQALISGGVNYGGQSGIAISSSGNDRLTWETADQYNAGFDLSFLGGKINMIADVYLKNTNNLLYSKPVHATTGETSILSNIGSMRNKGVEFTINTHLNLGKVLWSSSFNIARNVNKLTSLLEDDLLSIGANRALKLGRTVGSWYIFRTDGIYQYDGEVPQALYDKGVRAGDVKYWDRNGDGNITDDDRIVTGNPNPKFSGGWNNTFKYKGLELSLFFTYSYGNDVYASWMIPGSKPGHTRSLLKAYADNRWTGPGTSDKYPRAIYSYSGWNGKNSTMYLTDGSFIRLRSVTLGYTFPQRLVSKIHLKGLRVYAQGDNVFLCSRYPGWDPETSVNLDPRFYGEDNDGVPQPRIFKLGVNITF